MGLEEECFTALSSTMFSKCAFVVTILVATAAGDIVKIIIETVGCVTVTLQAECFFLRSLFSLDQRSANRGPVQAATSLCG